MRTHMYQIHWKTTTYNIPSHWLQSSLAPKANSIAEEYRLVKYIYITYCIYFSFHRSLQYPTSPFSSSCLSYFFSYHYHTHFPHTCFSTTPTRTISLLLSVLARPFWSGVHHLVCLVHHLVSSRNPFAPNYSKL